MDNLPSKILRDVVLEEIAPRTQKLSPADHWSPAILLERAAYLKKMARYGDGSAIETLREYRKRVVSPSWLVKGWILLSGRRLLKAYISSKSFVCRSYLFLGLVQSRTISSMVLPELMLFGCFSRMLLSVVLSANASASFESVQIGRGAFLFVLESIQPPFSFSP